jgi:hypothetical protein
MEFVLATVLVMALLNCSLIPTLTLKCASMSVQICFTFKTSQVLEFVCQLVFQTTTLIMSKKYVSRLVLLARMPIQIKHAYQVAL